MMEGIDGELVVRVQPLSRGPRVPATSDAEIAHVVADISVGRGVHVTEVGRKSYVGGAMYIMKQSYVGPMCRENCPT